MWKISVTGNIPHKGPEMQRINSFCCVHEKAVDEAVELLVTGNAVMPICDVTVMKQILYRTVCPPVLIILRNVNIVFNIQ